MNHGPTAEAWAEARRRITCTSCGEAFKPIIVAQMDSSEMATISRCRLSGEAAVPMPSRSQRAIAACTISRKSVTIPDRFSRVIAGSMYAFLRSLPTDPLANWMEYSPISGVSRENNETGRSNRREMLFHKVWSHSATTRCSPHQNAEIPPYVVCSCDKYWCKLPAAASSPRFPVMLSVRRGPGTASNG